MTMEDIDKKIVEAAHNAMVTFLVKGDWLTVVWSDRKPVDATLLRTIYEKINIPQVIQLAADQLADKMATAIVTSLVTEIGSDVKKIMSNNELREDLRAMVRAKIRASVVP